MTITRIERYRQHLETAAHRFLLPSIHRGVNFASPVWRAEDVTMRAMTNVHALGIGFKRVAGAELAGEVCLRFFVIQKLPDESIAPEFHIPKIWEGLPTDVIETPTALLGLTSVDDRRQCESTNDPIRPLQSGIAIAPPGSQGFGAIGWFCRSNASGEGNDRFLLSNWHVLTKYGAAAPPALVRQPPGSPNPGKTIAHLHRAATVLPGAAHSNLCDAAIAKLANGVGFELTVRGIGAIGGSISPPSIHQRVQKRGPQSCLSTGRISDFPYITSVSAGREHSPTYLFIDQMRIEAEVGSEFSVGGDSGSLVLEQQTLNPVGLLFAKDNTNSRYSIASPLSTICEELQIDLIFS